MPVERDYMINDRLMTDAVHMINDRCHVSTTRSIPSSMVLLQSP